MGKPAPPALDQESARKLSLKVVRFGLFMLATMVATTLPLPWQAIAPVLVIVAIVMGVRAIRAARSAQVRGILPTLLTVGMAFTIMLGLMSALTLAIWPVQMDYQECQANAITNTALDKCTEQFQDALTSWRPLDQTG